MRRTLAVIVCLAAFGLPVLLPLGAKAEGEASGSPPVPLDADVASDREPSDPTPPPPTPEGGGTADRPPADRGATFLRSHVARRMPEATGYASAVAAEAILAASRRARIDPVLLLAIIEVESGFDPLARSHRNAVGLMQVRPSTLWREAERSGLIGDDPHEPEFNVFAGALYFRRLVDAFGLNDVALMAYNAGPNRILGHIRAGEIPDRYFEYPRRVRAAELRLRRALALDSRTPAREAP